MIVCFQNELGQEPRVLWKLYPDKSWEKYAQCLKDYDLVFNAKVITVREIQSCTFILTYIRVPELLFEVHGTDILKII